MNPPGEVRREGLAARVAREHDGARRLEIEGRADDERLDTFSGRRKTDGERVTVICPANQRSAAALERAMPSLAPSVLGLNATFGFGDRLGDATPGHVAALRSSGAAMAPIFAQQSIREMDRTGRSPRDVLNDALFGVVEGGWERPWGADADHLKTREHVDGCVGAGYTFYTFDPGEHVDDRGEFASLQELRALFGSLPWDALDDAPSDHVERLATTYHLGDSHLTLAPEDVMRAAVKYGRAIAHAARLYRHLASVARSAFEVEVSVDETETPTTHSQHIYIASELRRRGVEWVSLAPRYVGGLEKGVDYIGDLREFERDFSIHTAIARALGPYKLSIHSGSDKFAIYDVAAHIAGGSIHVKTSGTSYLEALRTMAAVAPALFRRIYQRALESFEDDRATYHVSAKLDRVARADHIGDRDLPALLDDDAIRQILHVTFGSVLGDPSGLGDELKATLRSAAGPHTDAVARHLARHLVSFAPAQRS